MVLPFYLGHCDIFERASRHTARSWVQNNVIVLRRTINCCREMLNVERQGLIKCQAAFEQLVEIHFHIFVFTIENNDCYSFLALCEVHNEF